MGLSWRQTPYAEEHLPLLKPDWVLRSRALAPLIWKGESRGENGQWSRWKAHRLDTQAVGPQKWVKQSWSRAPVTAAHTRVKIRAKRKTPRELWVPWAPIEIKEAERMTRASTLLPSSWWISELIHKSTSLRKQAEKSTRGPRKDSETNKESTAFQTCEKVYYKKQKINFQEHCLAFSRNFLNIRGLWNEIR